MYEHNLFLGYVSIFTAPCFVYVFSYYYFILIHNCNVDKFITPHSARMNYKYVSGAEINYAPIS